jgi:glycosyltransferase involved in cell wall biosynthesis
VELTNQQTKNQTIMKFAIITHVPHVIEQNQYFAYAPYVDEMNIWAKNVSELVIVAPISSTEITAVDRAYTHPNIKFIAINTFDILSLKGLFRSVIKIPKISWQIYKAMQYADHIHLRCPGNIGLLGCLVQIAFLSKPKTAKYAGNWDPKSNQPWTYKLQQWILSNTFLTRNMQVLVYGQWEGTTKNIKPFFTATYAEADKKLINRRNLNHTIEFIFVGILVAGKNPLYAIRLVEKLIQQGYNIILTLYGDGHERYIIEKYCSDNNLQNRITFKGNQTKETIQKAYQQSHFVILPSDSEGWPKVIAEGMFWGCVPVATKISCVPYMLDNGNRGVLLDMDLDSDVLQIESVLNNQRVYDEKQSTGLEWSRKYTTDVLESEIKKLLR